MTGIDKKRRFLFEGLKNRDEAESMIGQLIFASITESDPINLISPDLLGATVVADNGEIIGELVDMMSLPANDAYGEDPDGHNLGGEDLIFVIEIVSID